MRRAKCWLVPCFIDVFNQPDPRNRLTYILYIWTMRIFIAASELNRNEPYLRKLKEATCKNAIYIWYAFSPHPHAASPSAHTHTPHHTVNNSNNNNNNNLCNNRIKYHRGKKNDFKGYFAVFVSKNSDLKKKKKKHKKNEQQQKRIKHIWKATIG